MSDTTTDFYVTGGPLPRDAHSYVERKADTDLYDALTRGEFCYVLTSRQMGKSSLMVRTAARLREDGVTVVVLDLTAVGQNLSAEQWYGGLLDRLGAQLDLEEELEEFWFAHERLGPLQRWMGALERVVLPQLGVRRQASGVRSTGPTDPPPPAVLTDALRLTPDASRLVVFIDEIDAVRSLPFSSDEFFAAIRECYTRRAEDPAFRRLTFCLLGVATPSDLIRDVRTTPFNIGRRIELTDFTEGEAAPLASGLGSEGGRGRGREGTPKALLKRILHWTSGHPYLTQRLCQAVVEEGGVSSLREVDRLCEELFLSTRARERDSNLLFVRERLLKSEADLASVLDLYGQVRSGNRVPVDDTNPLVDLLRLSGITRTAGVRRQASGVSPDGGWRRLGPRRPWPFADALRLTPDACLVVRNRIYERVFDGEWVRQHMPDAEVRRQRAAFRRGMVRAVAVTGAVVAVMAGLALAALNQAQRANNIARSEARQLYAADMSVAQQGWEAGKVARAKELLEAHRPRLGEEDLRGFEWRYLWRRCQGDALFTLPIHDHKVSCLAYSPDGKMLATGSWDKTVMLWDLASRRTVASLPGHTKMVNAIAFSPDGKTLATASDDKTAKLWDVASERELATLKGHTAYVMGVAFSPDGKRLATGSFDKTVKLWEVASRRQVASFKFKEDVGGVNSVAFSPDGRTLAAGARYHIVRLWNLATKQVAATLEGSLAYLHHVAFSPDGKLLAACFEDGSIQLWDVTSGRTVDALRGHEGPVNSLAFSPNGKLLATASFDDTVKLWDAAKGREVAILRGHTGHVWSVAFSPDGRTLATSSDDGTVRVWAAAPDQEGDILKGHRDWVASVAFSSDGKTLAAGDRDGTVRLWDVATDRLITILSGPDRAVFHLAFSPDRKILATTSGKLGQPNGPGELKLWDIRGKQPLTTLTKQGSSLDAVAFSPDGRTLVTGSGNGVVKLWDVASLREVATLPGHTDEVRSVAFSPDGKTLATGSFDKTVKLWDVATRHEAGTLWKHSAKIYSLAFSPDGRTLATSSGEGTVKLWDVASHRAVATLEGHGDVVAFAPDGKSLAASGPGNAITLWNVETKRAVAVLKGHTSFVVALAFSPDGKTLASGSADRTARLWRAATLAETEARGGEAVRRVSR